jgi:hypothetical protein
VAKSGIFHRRDGQQKLFCELHLEKLTKITQSIDKKIIESLIRVWAAEIYY